MFKGLILSGDTSILSEDVLNLMITDVNLLAVPSLVIPLEIDSELAAERLMNVPGMFEV